MEALYTTEDAEYSIQFFKTIHLGKRFKLYDDIFLTFYESGHVLGSAMIALDIKDKDDGKNKNFVFTGDMGRCKLPIINDPYQIKNADYLLIESTYGNRTHAPIEEGIPELARIINRTVRRGGKIIIPSFAFERTQELIYSLSVLIDRKEIPTNLPIFIDSPLANDITDIFRAHIELYDEEIRNYFDLEHNPFKSKQLKYIKTADESKELNFLIGPCIIISSSGMCEAGRIRHHLRNNIEDPKNTIAIVGYMAEHTLGRKLVDGEPAVKIFDQIYQVKSEIVVLESFSAHADMNDLDAYIKNINGLKKIMLVHGEENQSGPMAERCRKNLKIETVIMEPEKTIEF
jgi:metallo-beta-lactamase family protein